jgi:hypothetical protein
LSVTDRPLEHTHRLRVIFDAITNRAVIPDVDHWGLLVVVGIV